MRLASALVAGFVLALAPPCAAVARNAQDSCPATQPTEPRFTPPNAHDDFTHGFWHGDERLAVYLASQRGHLRPGQRQKMVWYRKGYSWRDDRPIAPLRITGRRLDANNNAAPHIEGPNNALLAKEFTVMMHIIVLPEAGCWQIEGNYEGDYLAFVVWVE